MTARFHDDDLNRIPTSGEVDEVLSGSFAEVREPVEADEGKEDE